MLLYCIYIHIVVNKIKSKTQNHIIRYPDGLWDVDQQIIPPTWLTYNHEQYDVSGTWGGLPYVKRWFRWTKTIFISYGCKLYWTNHKIKWKMDSYNWPYWARFLTKNSTYLKMAQQDIENSLLLLFKNWLMIGLN